MALAGTRETKEALARRIAELEGALAAAEARAAAAGTTGASL
jgi:BMFP domain-containing protein YqiC